jgi:hypothetical protein
MSEVPKLIMQESGVYPMERHISEFQAWNGYGDSKERTAARRHCG